MGRFQHVAETDGCIGRRGSLTECKIRGKTAVAQCGGTQGRSDTYPWCARVGAFIAKMHSSIPLDPQGDCSPIELSVLAPPVARRESMFVSLGASGRCERPELYETFELEATADAAFSE